MDDLDPATDDGPARPGGVPWPPLLLVGVLATGWALQRFVPLGWPAEPLAQRLGYAGIALIAAGLLLEITVAREFARVGTTVMPHRGATRLVTDGPFQRSRNPIYVAHLALVGGLGLYQGNPWWIALTPLLAFALDHLAVRPEERHLEARFGEDYRRYRADVRRWF